MDSYQETFETWNKMASLYQEKFMDLALYNESYDFICDTIVGQQAKLLEIGCGPGNITKYLLAKRPDFKIFGIDIAPTMIELAKKNNPTANFAVMDSREINKLKEKYEGIICGFCLPYLSPSDGLKLISDSYNLLNENGLLYLSFVEGDPKQSGFQTSSTGDRSYFYFYELEELKKQLTDNRFSEFKLYHIEYKRSESLKEMHTILIANKIASSKDN